MSTATVEKIYTGTHKKQGIQSFSPIRPVRVAVYCRVSTDQEMQQSSLEEQMQAFLKKIAEHPGWSLVDVYADEGLSGTSVKKRKAFLRTIYSQKAYRVLPATPWNACHMCAICKTSACSFILKRKASIPVRRFLKCC